MLLGRSEFGLLPSLLVGRGIIKVVAVLRLLVILLEQVFQLVGVDGLLELFVFLADGQAVPVGVLPLLRGLIDIPCRMPRSFGLKPAILGGLANEVEEPENQVAGDAI